MLPPSGEDHHMTLLELRELFPVLGRLVWLDTPAAPPAARPVTGALRAAVDGWETGNFSWREWEAAAYSTRSLFARLLGVPETGVALMSSLAEAAATVARSLPPGRIVLGEREFRSNLFPWLSLAGEGYEVKQVREIEDVVRTEDLVEAITPGTTLVAVSEVLSRNGNRADLFAVAARCKAVGARFFVNVTQSLGALRVDAGALGADYVACHGYKWLLAPRGCAWLYVRPDRLSELRPLAPSWRSSAESHRGYFGGPMELPSTAQKLDTSFSWLPWVGAGAALDIVLSLNAAAVEDHVLGLASMFRSEATAHGLRPLAVQQPSQIVVVPLAAASSIETRLADSNVVATSLGPAVRFGFHGFNDETDVEAALRVCADSTA
jgi:selenocysteine lyase/cysteine desulfurase